jgi:hypothetical protein
MTELTSHRAHDYSNLIRRWRRLAKATGLVMQGFSRAADFELFRLKSPWLRKSGGVYFSAGIHGDEPAGTEALIAWAEKNRSLLRKFPCMIFPCLNPWGLVNNNRFDQDRRDLNRLFQHDEVPMIRVLKQIIEPYQFDLALTLHEDFDAQGLYIYEPQSDPPHWGEDLIKIARRHIAIEGRRTIDGRTSRSGVLRRKLNPKNFPMVPEAVWLRFYHSRRVFTIESPSEFALDQRVRAQVAIIEECVRRLAAVRPGPAANRSPSRASRGR